MTTDCSLAAVQYRISVWNASRLLITFFSVIQSFWNYAQRRAVSHRFTISKRLVNCNGRYGRTINWKIVNWKIEKWIKIQNFSFTRMQLKISSELKSLWYTLIILSQPHYFPNVVCRMEFYYYWKDVLTPFLLFCYSVEPHLISNVISKRKSPWCGLTTKILALKHFQHVCNKYHA